MVALWVLEERAVERMVDDGDDGIHEKYPNIVVDDSVEPEENEADDENKAEDINNIKAPKPFVEIPEIVPPKPTFPENCRSLMDELQKIAEDKNREAVLPKQKEFLRYVGS